MNYNNKIFKPVSNSDNGEVTTDMRFHYKQEDNILTCSYHGEQIKHDHLIGIVDSDGRIDMRYHQINSAGKIMTGICKSTPTTIPNGKIRLLEEWQWTSGDHSKGTSVLEEV